MQGRRILPIIAAFLLFLSTGCGARLSKEQVEAAEAAANGGAAGGTASEGTGTGGTGTGTGGATATTVAGATGGGSTGGGSTGGTDPGTGGDGGVAGAAGCAPGGASDVGVTPTEIKLGQITTISGPVPGFGQTSQNATKAYLAYVNSLGGVCGRQLKLVTGDDRLDAATNRSQTEQMSTEVFAFAGSFSVVDDGGAAVLNGTNIPDVGLAITDTRISLPNNFSPNPIDLADGGNGTAGMMTYLKATYGVNTAAIVYPAQATARARAKAYGKDIAAAGITVAQEHEVSITETNYAPVAARIAADKIDLVITTLEVNGMARLAQALQQQQYKPKVPFYGAQAYGKKFLELAGAAGEGTVLGLAYDIFENKANNPSVDNFLAWYQRSNPGADIDFFAIQSWAATDLFVKALAQAGSEPTRDKVMAALQGMTTFDADGFLAPVNPAGKGPATCYVIATIEGGAWKRVYPDSGFAC